MFVLSTILLNAISLNAILLNEIPLNIKMNEIVNKFLLVGDKFMPEMHLKQLGCTYSGCGPFTENKERILEIQI